ncbi:MAG: type II toxin-antitoxin system VapC family toxin [Mariniphaga sp.]
MEKQVICLDTSVLIDYFRRVNKSKSFFYELSHEYELFGVSAVTEYEIYCGSNADQDLYWDEFFTKIISLPFDSEVNRVTIGIERDLRRKNKLIDKPDLMIAGTAMANKLKLATLNLKHFERIDGLELVQRK